MKKRSALNCQGFLLLEGMIASVVLAVASVGIASLLLGAHEQQQSIQEINTATLLARQLMEEISTKPLGVYQPALIPSSRAMFTTANQYWKYSDVIDANHALTTLDGTLVPMTHLGAYQRSVQIDAVSDPLVLQTKPSDVCMVTVTVRTPTGKQVTLSKWITNVTWGF